MDELTLADDIALVHPAEICPFRVACIAAQVISNGGRILSHTDADALMPYGCRFRSAASTASMTGL